MKRATSILLLGILLLPGTIRPARAQVDAEEASTAKLVAFNVALTGAFAIGRRLVEGEVDSWEDALETFLVGGVGGYGFYQAKRLVGDRHPLAGLGLAYLSASIVENAARGHHPLAYVRLGAGPLDVRWRTPLARRDGGTLLTLEVNLISAVSLVALSFSGYQPFFRNGWLYYKNTAARGLISNTGISIGRTFNRTVLLYRDSWFQPDVRAHETIHVIQALQMGAVTPYYRLSALWPGLDQSLGDVLSWDVQIDWLYAALAPLTLVMDYGNRWPEIEAYALDHPERDGRDWCTAPPSGACAAPHPSR